MIKNFLIDLLNNCEITVIINKDVWINKYRNNSYEIDDYLFLYLYYSNILSKTSSNFNLNEINYVLNIRDNKIVKIDYILSKLKNWNDYKSIKKFLIDMKLKEERLLKLKKLRLNQNY